MKTNHVAMLVTLTTLSLNQGLSPSISSSARVVITKEVEEEKKLVTVETAETRSLDNVSTSLLYFKASVFHAANSFYLGAATGSTPSTYALSCAYLTTSCNNNCNTPLLELAALAPQKAFVNASVEETQCPNAQKNKKDNPLYNADLSYLALNGSYPIAVPGTRNPAYTDPNTNGTNQMICLVQDVDKGEFVLTTTKKLNDAGGNPTGGIAGISGIGSHLFASVNHTGQTAFGGNDSGIAVVKPLPTSLEPIDATTGNDDCSKAVSVKQAACSVAAQIDLDDNSTLHWDGVLKKLYVGLQGSVNTAGTFLSGLLIGRMEGDKLILEPIIDPTVIATDTGTDKIFAFYDAATQTSKVAIHKIKTMYTSTGKTYLIVNGNIYPGAGSVLKTEVFALPIMHQQYSDGTFATNNKTLLGKIAKKDSISQEEAASSVGDLQLNTDAQSKVGQGAASDDVQNLFVLGDTVYVCLAGATRDAQGIFKSTAIFDKDGLIRSWTPWQRVMGATDPVINGFIDINTGQYWYLTQSINQWDTVKVTCWNQNDPTLLGNLASKLTTEFSQQNAGVHQLFNFPTQTESFENNKFALMVATGYQKVVLIQTGKDTSGTFVPTSNADFSTNITNNVKVFNDAALTTIGPICCAAVSRSPIANQGWLFVGGHNGVETLRDSNGNGWTLLENLTSDLIGFTFKTIGTFKNVHKLVCDDEYLYVLTAQALYRIAMANTKFKDLSPDNLDAEIIAQASVLGTQYDTFLDFIIAGNVGILATSTGLYRTANSQTIKTSNAWTQVLSASGYSLGPVTHLSMLSLTKGSFDGGGNLYVVAANMTTDLATVLRFNVTDPSGTISDTTIEPITELKSKSTDPTRDHYYAFGTMRTAYVPDGTFGYHTLPKHFIRTDQAQKVNMAPTQFSIRASNRTLPLGLESRAHNAGIPVQNTVSGAWIIPGDWGIRINE